MKHDEFDLPDALLPKIFKPGHGVALSFENFLEEKLTDLVHRMGGLETGDLPNA